MDKMKALVFKDVGKLVQEEIPVPKVKDPDDVLLKVKAAGICGTDVKILEGKHHFKPNTVLGHEFAARSSKWAHTSSMSRWATAWQLTTTSVVAFARSAGWA